MRSVLCKYAKVLHTTLKSLVLKTEVDISLLVSGWLFEIKCKVGILNFSDLISKRREGPMLKT